MMSQVFLNILGDFIPQSDSFSKKHIIHGLILSKKKKNSQQAPGPLP